MKRAVFIISLSNLFLVLFKYLYIYVDSDNGGFTEKVFSPKWHNVFIKTYLKRKPHPGACLREGVGGSSRPTPSPPPAGLSKGNKNIGEKGEIEKMKEKKKRGENK